MVSVRTTDLALVVREDDRALRIEELRSYDVVDREVERDDELQQFAFLGRERPLEYVLLEYGTEVGRDRISCEARGLVLNVPVQEIGRDPGNGDRGHEKDPGKRQREPADRVQGQRPLMG